jgi:hypothetical protein
LAAQHGLSPLAADYVEIWRSNPEKYDQRFLKVVSWLHPHVAPCVNLITCVGARAVQTHSENLASVKGWSFYGMQGPRWFNPRWFGLDDTPVVQVPWLTLSLIWPKAQCD